MNRYGFLVTNEQYSPSIWLVVIVKRYTREKTTYTQRKGGLNRVLCRVLRLVWSFGTAPPPNPDRGKDGAVLDFGESQIVFTIGELNKRVACIKARQTEYKDQLLEARRQDLIRANKNFIMAQEVYERVKNISLELDTETTELIKSSESASELNALFEEMEKWL